MTRKLTLSVAGVLVLGMLSGCSMIPGFSSAPSGGSDSSAAGSGNAASWIVATQGSATPSPRPSVGTATASPTSSGFLPLGTPAPAARTPAPVCSPNTFKFSRIDGMEVVPSATTAVLSWYNVGGYNLVEFRLYATSQDLMLGRQRDVGFVTVKPSVQCGRMSGTVVNLDPKTGYVFSVDAVVVRRSGDGTHAATIARSPSISTL